MNIIDFYSRKNEIINKIRTGSLEKSDASIELNLINAEAKKAGLEVALLDIDQILNEQFTGGEEFDREEEESYEESESYDDDSDW